MFWPSPEESLCGGEELISRHARDQRKQRMTLWTINLDTLKEEEPVEDFMTQFGSMIATDLAQCHHALNDVTEQACQVNARPLTCQEHTTSHHGGGIR